MVPSWVPIRVNRYLTVILFCYIENSGAGSILEKSTNGWSQSVCHIKNQQTNEVHLSVTYTSTSTRIVSSLVVVTNFLYKISISFWGIMKMNIIQIASWIQYNEHRQHNEYSIMNTDSITNTVWWIQTSSWIKGDVHLVSIFLKLDYER